MDEDLPDYTAGVPFPTLPEDLPDDFVARIQAAIAEFQQQLREQAKSGSPR